jgi:hypothetical protein
MDQIRFEVLIIQLDLKGINIVHNVENMARGKNPLPLLYLKRRFTAFFTNMSKNLIFPGVLSTMSGKMRNNSAKIVPKSMKISKMR